MAIDFPASPTVGQTYVYAGVTYTYTSRGVWSANSGAPGPTGPTGTQGTAGTSGGAGATGPAGAAGVATAAAPLVLTGTALSLTLDSTMRVNGSALGIANNVVLPGAPSAATLALTSTVASTSPTTGALTVGGGFGAGGDVRAGGNVYSNTGGGQGAFGFGSAGTQFIQYNGTFFNLAGAPLFVANATASTSSTTGALTTAGGLGVSGSIAAGSGIAGGGAAIGSAPGLGNTAIGFSYVNTGAAFFSAAGVSGSFNANAAGPLLYTNCAGANVGNIAVTGSSTAYNTSSDGRLKEDLQALFDAGAIIDATTVYDFAWKATGERAHGVIAQEAVEVYPQAVMHDEATDWWGTDYSKFVPLLLAELQSLRARVAVLEAKKG